MKTGRRGAPRRPDTTLALPGWGPCRGGVWCLRAPSRLCFRLVIPCLLQKRHKQKSKSNTRTFPYQNCYLFENKLCRFLKLVFNEFLRSHNFNNINIFIIRITTCVVSSFNEAIFIAPERYTATMTYGPSHFESNFPCKNS